MEYSVLSSKEQCESESAVNECKPAESVQQMIVFVGVGVGVLTPEC